MENNRISESNFTRHRKMPFPTLIIFLLSIVKKTLQKELSDFYKSMKKNINITKSAFSQNRIKLKHTAFIYLNKVFLEEYYDDKAIKLWKGFRLLAIDGSTLKLPSSTDIVNFFGTRKRSTMPEARISSCFDVLNEIVLDAQISSRKIGEFELAQKHLEVVNKNDLLIYDRGYGAFWLMFLHLIKGLNFVIRLQEKSFNEVKSFLRSDEFSRIILVDKLSNRSEKRIKDLNLSFKPFRVRLVKVVLENGEIEVLATSLLDEEKYSTSIFKDLYFKRWGVETNFGHLKNNILLEDFTGLTVESIKQDFYATIFISNYQSLIIDEVNQEYSDKFSKEKHNYKVNRNLSLGYLKDKIPMLFLKKSPDNIIEELKKLFLIEMNPIRNGRKFSRDKSSVIRKYSINHKRSI